MTINTYRVAKAFVNENGNDYREHKGYDAAIKNKTSKRRLTCVAGRLQQRREKACYSGIYQSNCNICLATGYD